MRGLLLEIVIKVLIASWIQRVGVPRNIITGNRRKRLEAAKTDQSAIMTFDAQRSLDLFLRRIRRTGETELLQKDDRVVIELPNKKKWVGTYRVLFDTCRNVSVDGNKAINYAKLWDRIRERACGRIWASDHGWR